MKNIYIGDIHGLTVWGDIVNQHKDFDNIVFIGDYLDSFDVPGTTQLENLRNIIEFKKSNMGKVHLLIGNHDIHYWPGINSMTTSGFQPDMKTIFTETFLQNKDLFKMCVLIGKNLCTHAGVSKDFLNHEEYYRYEDYTLDEFINATFKYTPKRFLFDAIFDRKTKLHNENGNDIEQSPVWIRPESLQKSNFGTDLKKNYIQIVGHTQQNQIDIKGKSTGGKYYYIDTLPSGQYLIEENDEFKIGRL